MVRTCCLGRRLDDDWNGNADPSSVPGMLRANTDGSDAHYVDSDKLAGWSSPRVDDQHLFYIRGGAVVRRRR